MWALQCRALAVLALAALTAALSVETTFNSSDVAAVQVCAPVVLLLTPAQSNATAATLTISDNLVDVLDAKLVGGVLSIFWTKQAQVDTVQTVTLALPARDELKLGLAGAAGVVLAPGFAFATLNASLVGASYLHAANVTADRVALDMLGASQAVLSGELGSVALAAEGASAAWVGGVSGTTEVHLAGASASNLAPASADVPITGSTDGVSSNSFTQGICTVVADDITSQSCNQVQTLSDPPAPPLWACGTSYHTPEAIGCANLDPSTKSTSSRRLASQRQLRTTMIAKDSGGGTPGAPGAAGANGQDGTASSGASCTSTAEERVVHL